MALFNKDERVQRPEAVRPPVMAPPMRPGEDGLNEDAIQAHLGKGSRIEGKLTFEGSVKVDGQVDGEIQAQEAVLIGETALLNAQITAGTVVLKGRLTGDIVARKRVELRAPGKLIGNITTPSLVIHEGVVFEGHCSMGGGVENKTEKPDRKVALFSKEERTSPSPVRIPAEAVK